MVRFAQDNVMTASRYSLGRTMVPSWATLSEAKRARRSAVRAARPFSSRAAKVLYMGP